MNVMNVEVGELLVNCELFGVIFWGGVGGVSE